MLVFKLEKRFGLLLFSVAFVEMRLPQQFGLGFSREVERAAANEQNELLQRKRHPRNEVVQISERPVSLALGDETLNKLLFNALQMHKTHKNRPTVQSGQILAAIDARQMDFRAHTPRLVEVKPSLVKSAEIVDHSHLKLKRIVAFQVEALVTLHRV